MRIKGDGGERARYQKRSNAVSIGVPSEFKPQNYESDNPSERKRLAFQDAKQHMAFYKELIKRGVYPIGTKVDVKRARHSDSYILEFWMPEVGDYDKKTGMLEVFSFLKRNKEKLANLDMQRREQERIMKDAANKRGYEMKFAEIDPDAHEEYGRKLRISPHSQWSEDFSRGNNWGIDESGKVRYLDMHVLNHYLPFKKRKRMSGERLYDQYEKQETARRSHTGRINHLEKVAVSTAIIGTIAGLFFLSSSLTGNVIGSLNQTSSNWIGGVLFLIGLVGAFAYFRKR